MNDKIAMSKKAGDIVWSLRYGPMRVEEVKFDPFCRGVFGIVVNAATKNGEKLLEYDSGADINRALFDVHELQDVPTFASWWRDVVELAKDRYCIDERMRPTLEFWLLFLHGYFPEDALRHVEGIEGDEEDIEEY